MGQCVRFRDRADFHVFAASWIGGMLVFARRTPHWYADVMQEDRLVEWSTAVIFLIAGATYLRRALKHRRLFDGLVGLFLVFVAGEEISWGQRLLGFVPPSPFLAHNTQQELTLHNFADVFGKPKWILAAVLVAYGVLLPASQRWTAMRAAATRVGATIPSRDLVPWYVICAALLVWYPVEFTGEWVELLSSTVFLAAAELRGAGFWLRCAAGFGAAGGIMLATGALRGDVRHIACARLEASALLHDIVPGRAANPSLAEPEELDKRLLSAADDGYLDFVMLDSLNRVRCPGEPQEDAVARREYGVDPWGTAYWLRTRSDTVGGVGLEVYSFGPNRRRDDNGSDSGGSDDVIMSGRYVP